jgi:hypothetical protein
MPPVPLLPVVSLPLPELLPPPMPPEPELPTVLVLELVVPPLPVASLVAAVGQVRLSVQLGSGSPQWIVASSSGERLVSLRVVRMVILES